MADPKPIMLPSTSDDAARPTSPVRPTKFLVAAGVVIAATLTFIAVALLVHLYDQATEQTQQTLSSLDTVLAEQTERSLDEVDITLKDTLALLLKQHGQASAQNIHQLYGGRVVTRLLRAEYGGMPQLASIALFDAHGRIVNSSDDSAPANLDIAFRSYFQHVRDNPTPASFISEPVKFQTTGMPVILMVRRLEAPDGSFAGIISGAIPLDYFTNLYRDIYLGPGTAVSLFDRDGLMLARYPQSPAVGTNVADRVAFPQVLAHNAAGVIHSNGHILGKPLFIATHALNNLPLAVNVIMTDKRAYAVWRNEFVGVVIALTVILGMVGLLTLLALRHFASYVNLAEARLETTRATEGRARAEAMTQAKSRFLANMSHELRTPLNAIIGFSEIIETAMLGPLQQRYREYAHDIRTSGAHLLEIVNDILDISKAEANALKVGREPLDVAAIVAEVDRIVRAQAERAKVNFNTRLDPNLPSVIGDETRFRQILINLVSNALKFTPAGGSVTVSARKTAKHMVIEVKDTGIGMAEEDIPAALRPFEQLDNSIARKYGGTGLGLPLTKHLVELLGGRFSITSAIDKGTTVAIEFECQRRAA
ncbi:MAG TPA: ATP-binding protein [Stellaceae bacterium]|nr:ATP-binding protein [Stellaceae bacterium]